MAIEVLNFVLLLFFFLSLFLVFSIFVICHDESVAWLGFSKKMYCCFLIILI